ncbi:MAG TPA: alpha/beta hydrolase [Acidimicrobiia bacterium]|nr:alpha/beta hydrolase [Acidimicrobiia bacterium]
MMEHFASFDGTTIAFRDAGAGRSVLLLHGFAADQHANWTQPGVVDDLVDAGHRVLAPDARGHGRSEKPTEPERYADDAMVRDAQALLDHLGIEAVDVVGYSMGALVSSRLVLVEPRARSLVLGGFGAGLAGGRPPANRGEIADALVADDPATIARPVARAFRAFADRTGADRQALAAIQRAPRAGPATRLEDISIPTLVIAGDRDVLVGSPQAVADRIPGARARVVHGDHLTAVGDPAFRGAIVEFLAAQPWTVSAT